MGTFSLCNFFDIRRIRKIKTLCSKKLPDYRSNLAGLLLHEHKLDVKKLFPIILPYINSYAKAYADYSPKPLNGKIELMSAWVNYMTKFESNPLHTHDDDLSFVIYTQVPKQLKKNVKKMLVIQNQEQLILYIL